jgi:hypothetical protein
MATSRALRLCGLMALIVSCIYSQEFRATITGRITDPSGAGIANANVAAKNVQTNEQATAVTGADGDYTIPLLKPGSYSISADATGFKRSVRDNIQLFVGDRKTVDFALEVGPAQESITVTAAAPMLDEATATRGGVIENLRVEELPLNGRNPFMLSNLVPGVQFNGNPVFTRPFDNGDNANFSINGGLRQTNEFLIDGAPDNAVTDTAGDRSHANQNVAYIPTVDATQEFKIVTNFYDAQYGRTGGGVISVSTKSGTNDLHGTAYDFLRRYQWDANNIAANAAGRPIYAVDPVTGENLGGHKLDQYGFQLTGPVVIPKIYNGKDKTFFSVGWENYRESTPSPGLTSVPTLAERAGDFSQTGLTIYDPFSTRANPAFNSSQPQGPNNAPFIRDQFPNNMIPVNRLNPIGLAIANAYPKPNVGGPNQLCNNYLSSPNLSLDKFKNTLARVDQNFGEKERLFFRYAWNRRQQFDQGTAVFPGIGFDAQDPLVRENHNAVADSITVLTPNMIVDLRLAFTRYIEAAFRNHVYGFDATQLGFPASFSAARPDPIPPRIQLEQYGTDFGTRNQRYNVSNVISFTPSLSWIKGKHSLRFGLDFRDIRVNTASGSFVWGGGQFHFNRDFTTRFPGIQQNDSGAAVASLLLGTPDSGIIQYTPRLAYRWPYYGLYVQDDIRLTSKLSLNLGLRWDVEGSPTERYNRMNRGFDMTAADPRLAAAAKTANSADCPACANLTGGLLFAGVNGQPEAAFNTEHDHFQPRIGAAYQLTPKTVLRGGFGIFYLPEADFGGVAGFAVDTPFVATVGGGASQYIPVNTLSNPFPSGLFQATGSSQGLATFAGSNSVIFVNPDRQIPHVNQYSVGLQHQLPWNVKIDASYVGSRTYDLNTNDNQVSGARNINVNSAAQLAQARQNPNFFNQSVPNPFAGLLPGTNLNGATVARSQLLKPFPQFNSVNEAGESVGRLWYDAFQLSVEKRFTQGLVLVLAYTRSKTLEQTAFLNSQDAAPVKEIASYDRPNRFVLSGVYELPFGRGRLIGGGVNRGINMLIAGWEYSFIGTIQSGAPIGLPGNVDLIGNPNVSNQTFAQWFNGCVAAVNGTATCSNPAFQLRGPNTLRTIPFQVGSLRNPTRPLWDMSLNKRIYFTERFSFQARLETFNVFNSPVRGGPNTDPTRADFGLVPLGQSNIPRQVQIGLKLNF